MSITLFTAAYVAALAAPTSGLSQAQQGAPFVAAPAVQVHDLDASKRDTASAPQRRGRTAGRATAELPGAAPVARPSGQHQKPTESAESAKSFGGPTRVQRFLKAPMTQVSDGAAIVRGEDYKAILSQEGLLYSAVVGRRGNADIRFSLSSIERGGESLALRSGEPSDSGSALQIDRGAAVESYHYGLQELEQTFTFDKLTGTGDLVVHVNVKSNMEGRTEGETLVFENDLARIQYSGAFVFDATGERMPIETTWSEGEIALTVPASYLASATLPVTIDPLINTFTFTGGTLDDSKPDLAFDTSRERYFVVFEDFVSATDADAYGFSVTETGVVDLASFINVDIDGQDLRRPRVAVHPESDTFMVVAAVLPVGDTRRRILGRMIQVDAGVATGLTVLPSFIINDSPGSWDCYGADVGGNTFASSTDSFVVTWTRTFNSTDRDIHARMINRDGSFATGRINIDDSGSADSYDVRVSSSIGNTATEDYYNTVWVQGDGTGSSDTHGMIKSRRLYFNGTFFGPSPAPGVVAVDSSLNCSAPVTTATLDRRRESNGEAVHIVAYNEEFGTSASIIARVVTFGNNVGGEDNISVMEDFDFPLDQRDVDITTDGKGFMIAYTEEFNSSGDYDIYYASGHYQDGPGNALRVTLGERHINLAFSSTQERHPAISSQFDGGNFINPQDDDACIVWEDVSATNAKIEGATVDMLNNIPFFGNVMLGSQFCQAVENASGDKGWIYAAALDQSVGSAKTLVATDITANAFGYLLVANSRGSVANPGGAIGTLCVLGAGRYVNQIANSGSGQSISSVVNPLAIPQPTGFQSIAPGETWYFQYWHRDVTVGGTPSSNFTNALQMTFTP